MARIELPDKALRVRHLIIANGADHVPGTKRLYRTESRQIASSTLILEFKTYLDPAYDPRIVGTGSDEEKKLRLKEYNEAMARHKQKE